jgi:hypothetical protein
MRRWVTLLASFVLVLPHGAMSAPATLRVLFVGNSLTYYNSLPSLVSAVAAASTPAARFDFEMLAAPGASMRQHLEEGQLVRVLAAGHFDVVVFQELGGFPICASGYRECEASPVALEQAVKLIKKSGARPIMLGTYQPTVGQDILSRVSRETAQHLGVEWFDWGAALARVAARDASIPTLIPNNFHPLPAGSWLAAIGLAKLITGAAPSRHAIARVCAPNWIDAKPPLTNTSLASKQLQPPPNCSEISESTYQVLRDVS